MLDITDRRNELAGNLSLYQELHGIEVIDRLLAEGVLVGSRYKHITVRVLEFARPPSTRLLGSDVQAQPRRPVPARAHGAGRAAGRGVPRDAGLRERVARQGHRRGARPPRAGRAS